MELTSIKGATESIIRYLTDAGIFGERNLLEALEAYKFVTAEDIASAYNDEGVQPYEVVVRDINRQEEFTSLEKKYNVLLEKHSSDTIFVYAELLSSPRITSLELELGLYNVEVFYVTPYNFMQLMYPEKPYAYKADVLFKRILIQALRLRATDLHFDVKHIEMEPAYTISYRRGSDLFEMDLFNLNKILNSDIISKLIESKTGVSSLDLLDPSGVVASASNLLGSNDVELRIAANKVQDGYHYVIRIQQKETFSFSLNKLGFAKTVLEDLEEITRKRNGITLITGAIRTGKNTTAFALANEIKDQPIKIISYESPIEVLMPFTQVDYLGDENILLNAVRLAKKQDVNIAFLNEIPNKEVAFAIRDLANSSVHVITTMHMNRIWHLPYKLKEYYGEDYKDVISQINGVFNQKMFGVNCDKCRHSVLVDEFKINKRKEFFASHGIKTAITTHGCSSCKGSGLKTGANQPYVEHLIFSEEIIDKLLACDHPFQMEVIIREEVRKKQQTLEEYMMTGFVNGDIPLNALDQIC